MYKSESPILITISKKKKKNVILNVGKGGQKAHN